MDLNFREVPLPRPLSVILLVCTMGLNILSTIDHQEINLWIATAVGVCALISYSITFVKWLRSRRKKR